MAKLRNPHDRNRGERISARDSVSGSTDGLTPIFCLRYLSPPFCVTSCQQVEQASFAVTLRRLSMLTWQEIKSAHRHGLGTEKIGRASIKAPIPKEITDDVDFLAVRFHGKAPMVGFRSNQIFHVVWLDRAFTLYNH